MLILKDNGFFYCISLSLSGKIYYYIAAGYYTRGKTNFPFLYLENLEVADIMSEFLKKWLGLTLEFFFVLGIASQEKNTDKIKQLMEKIS